MALPLLQRRPTVLFGAVVIAHIVLISGQVSSRSGVPVLESATLAVFAEVQRAAAVTFGAVRSVWVGYVDLRGVRVENAVLTQQLDALQFQLQEERAAASRSRQLQDLLELRSRVDLPTSAADVIGMGPSLDFRTITIDRGTAHGLAGDMAVLSPGGVVGRVVTPSLRAAKVQLLIDRNAAAGAMIERTRAQGVVLGTGEPWLRLDHVSGTSDLREGDVVVTSGTDLIYPKGFLIGHVERVERAGGEYRTLTVRPSVDLRSLESVLVVVTPPVVHEGER